MNSKDNKINRTDKNGPCLFVCYVSVGGGYYGIAGFANSSLSRFNRMVCPVSLRITLLPQTKQCFLLP